MAFTVKMVLNLSDDETTKNYDIEIRDTDNILTVIYAKNEAHAKALSSLLLDAVEIETRLME